MEQQTANKLCLLLDSEGMMLAYGYLESLPADPEIRVRVAGAGMSEVLDHEDIQLMVGDAKEIPDLLGRIVDREGDILRLERIKVLGAEARQNLRMPIRFQSFIYPISGKWQGRRTVESRDLSCGGLAFYCAEPLASGEQLEIVIPVTEEPLVLRSQILRQRPSGRSEPLYAAKFLDLCADEERMVREAVFSFQLQSNADARLMMRE